MKTLFLLIILFTVSTVSAQMDERFYYPEKKWKTIDSIPYKSFEHLFDNDTVTSYLLQPAEGTPKATILYFHGAGGNVSTYVKFIKPLLKDGFQVFMVDFRGYGKSSGKPTHLNIASDGQKWFDFAKSLPEINGTPLILMGVSMGTQIAAHLARNNESSIKALVLDGCISSFTEIAIATSPPEYSEQIRSSLISPYAAQEDVSFLKKCKVLFVYSKQDKDVPFAETEKVIANCNSPEKVVYEFVGNHLMAPVVDMENYLAYMRELLKNE